MILHYSTLQSFFTTFSFSSLFLLVLSYWTQASFFSRNRYKWVTSSFTWLSLLSLTSLLFTRWFDSGHFPISNLYESLIFLSWGFVLGHITLESVSKNDLLGTVTSPMALFTNGFAAFSLPKDMQQATALVPALQSNWLMMHVSIMVLSYVALFCGSLLSIAFLLLTSETFFSKSKAFFEGITNRRFVGIDSLKINSDGDIFNVIKEEDQKGERIVAYQTQTPDSYVQYSKYGINLLNDNRGTEDREEQDFQALSPLASTLDNLSYRALGLGFPLLTVGILSGAVWANEAWGSYWSWDPKESWALITWLVFAIYLHMRLTRGWVGKKPAIIATLGFLAVWFCYLGVNLLGVGLHSYGWFQRNV